MSVKQNKILLITFLSFCFIPFSYAENNSELKMLQNKTAQQETLINQQQKVIEELLERVSRIEQGHTDAPKLKETIPAPRVKDTSSGSSTRVSLDEDELTSIQEISVEGDQQYPILEFNGYFDIGYADAGGDGSAASSSSTQVNSRGDTVSSLDIGGSSSFLVNEIEFGLTAHLSESTDAIVRADLLPRNTDFESSGSDSSSDTAEIDVAYIAHALELPDNLLLNNLFGDLVLSAGKLESAMGIEYRYNRSPDRVNISRSHQSVYSTGYPVGVRARGQLFKEHLNQFHNSNITYNLILGNSDPFISSADDNLDSNNNRTFQGRTSYGVDLFGGMFETGFSLLHGARGAQPDTNQETDFIAADARYENGPFGMRFEWQTADEDAPGGDTERKFDVDFEGFFAETFYEFGRPSWWPDWIPLHSFTPYYRYDTRDFFADSATDDSSFTIDIKRHTFAFRYLPTPNNILKFEYQRNRNEFGPEVEDDMFLVSYVRPF